jgi:hypothetical protein
MLMSGTYMGQELKVPEADRREGITDEEAYVETAFNLSYDVANWLECAAHFFRFVVVVAIASVAIDVVLFVVVVGVAAASAVVAHAVVVVADAAVVAAAVVVDVANDVIACHYCCYCCFCCYCR